MAQSTETGYELYGVFAAVSIGSKPYKGQSDTPDPDGTRSLTLMQRPRTSDDPYGGFKQTDSLHGVEVSEVPDGMQMEPADHPAYGYDDDRHVAVYIKDDNVVTVAWHTEADR